jgi:hypothetical protein
MLNGGMKVKPNGLAAILAQAPAVSAAFGKWPGFVLMMTAMLVVLALGVAAVLVTTKSAIHLIEASGLPYRIPATKMATGQPSAIQKN